MPYKHFTANQRDCLQVILSKSTGVTKIAELLEKRQFKSEVRQK